MAAGFAAALSMFAFVLWDKAEKRLFLARDRFGKNHSISEIGVGLALGHALTL